MTENLLELKQITKVFPGVMALKDVNFSCTKGEVHALVGENGAGKSTLMKILSGVYETTAGSIELNGEVVQFKSTYESQLKGISIIFQEFSLIPTFTVSENIFLNREHTKRFGLLNRKEARQKTQQLLDDIGFDLNPDAIISDLSVVQQQVVEIVKALSVTAQVLIMDEPSASLTDVELKKLFEIINTLKKRGVTVIYISHRLEEVFEIADRVTVLKDGEVMGTKNVSDISKDDLISMMVGRQISDIFPPLGKASGSPLLEVKGLNVSGSLFDIDFTLNAGEVLGVSGIVGAGRSLLAKCIFGVVERESGDFIIEGEKSDLESIEDAIELGIGYIPEDRKAAGIIYFRTAKENITLANLSTYKKGAFIDKNREIADTKHFIEALDIRVSGINQLIEEMSGGNQQKTLISRWLLKEPKIVIFDEPTRGIDVGAKYEIYRIIRMLANEGKAVLMISSELPEIIGLSDRIMVMRRGRIEGILDQHEKRVTEEEVMSIAVGHTYTL
jgi:ABC-type sugar transport system ATPase subunit